jgi:hypothetical protein
LPLGDSRRSRPENVEDLGFVLSDLGDQRVRQRRRSGESQMPAAHKNPAACTAHCFDHGRRSHGVHAAAKPPLWRPLVSFDSCAAAF